jgi:hypothetical protein
MVAVETGSRPASGTPFRGGGESFDSIFHVPPQGHVNCEGVERSVPPTFRSATAGWLKLLDPGLLLVALLLLIAISPLFPRGLPAIADAPIHLFRTMELVSCWRDGVYYPRWAPNLAFGYGYPLFDFAPPLPYFIAGTLHVLGFTLETSIKLLSVFCLALYGWGMYLFARNILGARGALLAAAAYIYTPFRFWETLLYGGNYPQIMAIGLFPWVLWAFQRLVLDGRRRYTAAAVLSYGALILSHNFHALVFTAVLALYVAALLLSAPETRRSTTSLFRAIAALALSLALTAFFWAPAIYDLQYVVARPAYYLARSNFYVRLLSVHDLLAPPLPLDRRAVNPYVPLSLGTAVIILAAIGLVCLLYQTAWRLVAGLLQKESRNSNLANVRQDTSVQSVSGTPALHLALFALILGVAVTMMLPVSAPVWQDAAFLSYAEFPWRLMGLANLAVAFLAGGSLGFWSKPALLAPAFGRSRASALQSANVQTCQGSNMQTSFVGDAFLAVSLAVVILAVAVYLYPTRDFLQWGNPTLRDYIRYEGQTGNLGTTGLAEYLPRWAEEVPSSSPLARSLLAGEPIEKLQREALPPGVQASRIAHTAILDRYRFASPTPFTAHFLTFYFPGWQAYLDGEPTSIKVTSPLGLMAVAVPAGEHEVLLRFGETPFRLAADLVSLAALAFSCLYVLVVNSHYKGTEALRLYEKFIYLVPSCFRALVVNIHQEATLTFSWGRALPLGGLLLAIFVAKVAFVDPYTSWFRQESPPDQVAGAQHPAHVTLEDNVLFLGYDLEGGGVVREGARLHVRLYWQSTGPVSVDYMSFVHLDAPPDDATFATSDNFQPGDPQTQSDVPSTQWTPALYARDEHRLAVPEGLPPIAYRLRAGLYNRQTGRRLRIVGGDGQEGDTLTLQFIHVLPREPLNPATIRYRDSYRLGEQIGLLGYALDTGSSSPADVRQYAIRPGDTITVTLYWQGLAPLEQSYTVFVHLLDKEGRVKLQHDTLPLDGRYPTTNWLPGQLIEDRHVLLMDPATLPGEYRVVVGMYELATLRRLPALGAQGRAPDDAIPLKPTLWVRE